MLVAAAGCSTGSGQQAKDSNPATPPTSTSPATSPAQSATDTSTSTTSPSPTGPPRISTVQIAGSVANPVITVQGHGFGRRPAHDPSCHPGNNACGHYTGYEFGDKLFFQAGPRSNSFRAGRFQTAPHEFDAIGLLVSTYTNDEVVFRFGSGYRALRHRKGWTLRPGERCSVTIRDLHGSTTVSFG